MNIFSALNKNYKFDFKLSIMDIGARDYLQWPWNKLDNNFLDIFLFEPEEKEATKLKNNFGKNLNIFNNLLSDKEESVKLNINKSPGTSSILKPNFEFLDNFSDISRFETINKVNYYSTTLDKLYSTNKIGKIDFVKIDTQGSELKILKGGKSFLDNIIGLEIEINFNEIYKEQCFFSDVDNFVRNELNLNLWDIKTIDWKYVKGVKNSFNKKGQIISGDALYLKSISQMINFIENKEDYEKRIYVIKLILISLIYGFIDYSNTILFTESLSKFLNIKDKLYFEQIIKGINRFSFTSKKGNKYLYYFFHFLSEVFKQSLNNSNRSKRNIGSEKIGTFWI
tara:strand:+ start:192 stop:1208 length:1017 start_codon:yes stop_codon:yes gene_type:complete